MIVCCPILESQVCNDFIFKEGTQIKNLNNRINWLIKRSEAKKKNEIYSSLRNCGLWTIRLLPLRRRPPLLHSNEKLSVLRNLRLRLISGELFSSPATSWCWWWLSRDGTAIEDFSGGVRIPFAFGVNKSLRLGVPCELKLQEKKNFMVNVIFGLEFSFKLKKKLLMIDTLNPNRNVVVVFACWLLSL